MGKSKNWFRYRIFKKKNDKLAYLKTKWISGIDYREADEIIKNECKDIISAGGKIFDFHNNREVV